MSSQGVQCVFHYVPLHSSKIGKKIGRISGDMSITEDIASRLVRLPLWLGVDAKRVIECVNISILES
jgi:dTDP-4-amino-4,6-dideoxygalactose transaminase